MSSIKRFNLRVYAIITKEDSILLADETINDFAFIKFPGGGVEYGEGLMDALKRELHEEGEISVLSGEHLYTTDFFQSSAFDLQDQIISVYYRVKADIPWNELSSNQSVEGKQHNIRLYFKKLSELNVSDLTFPIDKYVFENVIKIAYL